MKTTQLLPDLNNILKRQPNLHEIETLLDFYQHPAVLLDIKSNVILLANHKSTELTAFTRHELREMGIQTLIPDWDQAAITKGQTSQNAKEYTLHQRSGIQTPVYIRCNSLGPKSQWAMISLERKFDTRNFGSQTELLNQKLEALYLLSRSPQKSNREAAFRHILQAGQLLTGASALAIYLKNENGSKITKQASWGHDEFLPASLSTSEINHLRIPFVWRPGERVISEIHNAAISENVSYMGSTPIDPSEPLNGILVLSDQISKPETNITRLLEIIAGTVSTYLTNQDIISDFENKLINQSQNLDVNSAIKDSINDGFIVTGPDLLITEINSTAEITLGYQRNEVVGHKLENILVGSQSLITIINTLPDLEPGAQNLGEFNLHRRDGKSILVNLRVVPIRANTSLESIAILITDLTKDQEFRNQAKQLEQQALLGEFSQVFAHEVRNPINNISTGLQLMAMNFPEDEKYQAKINQLQMDCDRLNDLMTSVLSFSKKQEYKMESLDILQIINNLAERSRHQMLKSNITFLLKSTEDLPRIRGDRRSLEQVFTNLITNAIHAMKKTGGTLAVNLAHSNGSSPLVTIDVTDTGAGIPDPIREKIFDPFFTTNKEGTGLGLSITKRIITAHNGQISVESFPGGTVFHMQFPAIG
ncbi:MAG: ATP-binding protein [Anaerolineae bacterium]|nr:ATP-binding protein [Anaerolineae bacterium]